MKTIITIVAAIMICAVMVFSVQAEMKKLNTGLSPAAQVVVPVTVTFAGCPPGFTPTGNQSDPASFKCVKNRPVTPCAPGYDVKWTPCPASEQPCSYSCSASAPSAAAKNNFDKGICAKKANNVVSATSCWMNCVEVPR